MTLKEYLLGKVSWYKEPVIKVAKKLNIENLPNLGTIMESVWKEKVSDLFSYDYHNNTNSEQIYRLFMEELSKKYQKKLLIGGILL